VKAAYVVPRYGPAIIGGAETAARLLAQHLVSGPGWEVEVLTGCAEDFVTWEDVYPPGVEELDGVTVRRFAATAGRDPAFHPLSASLLADPDHATVEEADRWVDLQGPVVPGIGDAAAATDADVVVFYPYLYHPTVRVIDRVPVPTVLHPAAHDEPALRLPVFPPVFAAADGLVFQTSAERALVQGRFPVASHRQLLLGLGVDDPDRLRGNRPAGPPPPSGRDDPYLLCLGRVEGHKGTTLLVELFAAYAARHPGPLRLVLAGPVIEAPPTHPRVDLLGPVDEERKWSLLEGAVALVSPSPWEAFSLVVAEAWSARIPVLVNAACAATVEHCRRSGGGVTFAGFGQFEAGVDLVTGDSDQRDALGHRGRAYVDRWFRWPRLIDRYAAFLESVVASAHR
jgi:glycosyltransferase involved in cell wall biosynthesis